MKKFVVFFALFCVVLVSSCSKEGPEINNAETTPYNFVVPKKFPPPLIPPDNLLTVEGVQLGRMLYYDPILSSNGLSCSSCHISEKSYSSPLFVSKTGEKISVPPHINLAWNPNFNWSGSEPKLDLLCLGDFGPDFFNTNMNDLVNKLRKHNLYPRLFKTVFQIDDVSALSHEQLKLRIVYAISQFLRSMVSSESKFDKMFRHELMLSDEEYDGFVTFITERGDCFHCHDYPLLTSNTFNNNGLDGGYANTHPGRFLVTRDSSDYGKFSVPTLRNIEFTAPYMHDGRFNTLEEVVEFYNSGVNWTSPNIDPLMTKPGKKYGLNLTPLQKENLVKFLKTLSDTSFINNPAYRSPFL